MLPAATLRAMEATQTRQATAEISPAVIPLATVVIPPAVVMISKEATAAPTPTAVTRAPMVVTRAPAAVIHRRMAATRMERPIALVDRPAPMVPTRIATPGPASTKQTLHTSNRSTLPTHRSLPSRRSPPGPPFTLARLGNPSVSCSRLAERVLPRSQFLVSPRRYPRPVLYSSPLDRHSIQASRATQATQASHLPSWVDLIRSLPMYWTSQSRTSLICSETQWTKPGMSWNSR